MNEGEYMVFMQYEEGPKWWAVASYKSKNAAANYAARAKEQEPDRTYMVVLVDEVFP